MFLAGKLRTFYRMDTSCRSLILEVFCVTAFTSAAMRIVGVPRTQLWLRNWAEGHRAQLSPIECGAVLAQVARAERAVRGIGGLAATCLVRSLALWALLLRRGLAAEIRIGVRKRDGRFEGHAWVEHNRVPVNEEADVALSYQPHGESVRFDRWV